MTIKEMRDQGLISPGLPQPDDYDYSNATALSRDLYTVNSPTGFIPAGDIVPNAWLPGLTPAVRSTGPRPASKVGYVVAAVGVGLVAWMLLGRRKNPPRRRTRRRR